MIGRSRVSRRLPAAVLVLGFVSFLNDFSSEMIYPLLPVFLSSVLGAGAIALGVIEGFAELVASVLKIASGVWADRLSRRKPLVVAGYSISGLLRPLIGLASAWPVVLILRVGDRVGKGVRTSPRDALIADITDEESRGAAFGVQRALDHGGAVAGPLVAGGLLALGLGLRSVFLLAFVPAFMVLVALVLGVREKSKSRGAREPINLIRNWSALGGGFHRMLLALGVFTLGNSTDAFLLLRLSWAGVSTEWVATLWAVHHVVKMASSALGGWMSDRLGRRPMVIAGWLYYALIYCAFGLVSSPGWLITIFILYGVYYGLTEPTEKAWVADLAPKKLRAEAFGRYSGAIGLAALPASLLFGVLWSFWSPTVAFLVGAILALIAGLILLSVPGSRIRENGDSP